MDYNTQRERLVLPEYGRTIQNMVDYALTIQDRATRQKCCQRIIRVMALIYPKDQRPADFDQMLWDHLAMMSHYKLDIDWPYEVPAPDHKQKPKRLPYPMKPIKLRHYGHLVEELLDEISKMEPSPERDRLTELAANQMKKDLYYWNKNALNEQKIADDINHLTDGRVSVAANQVKYAKTMPAHDPTSKSSRRQRKSK